MKCPYCGAKGVEINGRVLHEEHSIHSAVCCKNPTCTAYKPLVFGPHPEMSHENRKEWEEYVKVIEEDSDFDFIPRGFFERKQKRWKVMGWLKR